MFDTPFCFARESQGIGDLLGRWMWQGLWRSLWSFRNKYVDDRLWVKDSDCHHVDSCCITSPALPFLDSHVLKHLQHGCLNRGPTLSPLFRATFQVDVFIPPGEAKCMSVTSLQAAFLWWDEATTLLYYCQNKQRLYQCSRIKRWDVIVHDQSCFFACHHQRSCRNGSIWRCLANLAFRSDNCQEEGHRSTKDHLWVKETLCLWQFFTICLSPGDLKGGMRHTPQNAHVEGWSVSNTQKRQDPSNVI